jgi:LAGLIDADG DNA endonuclease family/Proton-conducting membrane transporter/NADH-Ubiquinone oxidoreductase (complex I), chain 5 N-terminus
MYLNILLLPLLSSIVSGLFGRFIGRSGAHFLSCALLVSSAILGIIAFFEVGINQNLITLHLFQWINSELLVTNLCLNFDSLTVSMLLPVLIVSSLVHIYSVDYMANDPHSQRFFSYLSLFTFSMLILVCGDSYLLLFVGWELIGVSSYLLINFWYTRLQANKSSLQAMMVNRVGDYFLSLSFLVLIAAVASLDFTTTYSLSPYVHTNLLGFVGILFLLAAAGKSAQIGLHAWLPNAMEGQKILYKLIYIALVFLVVFLFVNYFKGWPQCISNWDLKYQTLPTTLLILPNETLETITGNMLGDGSIRCVYDKETKKLRGNARYGMTMKAESYNYMLGLYDKIYKNYSTTGLIPYPNPQLMRHKNKKILQYTFQTKSLPLFTDLFNIWYKWNDKLNKYEKRVPENISDMFSVISLAQWIMNDGYFDSHGRTKTILLCTESFIKTDLYILQNILLKLNIVSTLKIRNKEEDTYRIRISKDSMPLLKRLVVDYMHEDFKYKLGL